VASVNTGLRGALLRRGVDTGRFGSWLSAQRVLVRVVLGALAVLWLMLLRPLSVGEVFLVLIVWLLVWWVFELLQRRPEEATAAEAARAEAATQAEGDDLADTLVLDADTVVVDANATEVIPEAQAAATGTAAPSGTSTRP
jgi:hypothetical protein